MLWESDPSDENVQRLEELGLQSTVFDPCGNRPATGNFLGVMTRNVDNMDRLFSR
jgi:zinc transport system substrate-binding protein